MGESGAVISPTVFYDLSVIGAYHVANGAVKMAALRSCEEIMTAAPVAARSSRLSQRVETPACMSLARIVSAR